MGCEWPPQEKCCLPWTDFYEPHKFSNSIKCRCLSTPNYVQMSQYTELRADVSVHRITCRCLSTPNYVQMSQYTEIRAYVSVHRIMCRCLSTPNYVQMSQYTELCADVSVHRITCRCLSIPNYVQMSQYTELRADVSVHRITCRCTPNFTSEKTSKTLRIEIHLRQKGKYDCCCVDFHETHTWWATYMQGTSIRNLNEDPTNSLVADISQLDKQSEVVSVSPIVRHTKRLKWVWFIDSFFACLVCFLIFHVFPARMRGMVVRLLVTRQRWQLCRRCSAWNPAQKLRLTSNIRLQLQDDIFRVIYISYIS
jgi:hypothetical protein